MPKIIRSTGVNIERARPLALPMKPREAAVAQPLPAPAPDRQVEIKKIQASAELIVEEILDRARNDADNMLVNARAETMRVLQEAVQEGRDQGLQEARAEWAALKQTAESEVEQAIEALRAERRQIVRELEGDILSLVFDIVEKVLSMEMNRSDGWVEAMVKAALQQMEGDESVVLKVSSAARQRVTEAADRILAESGRLHGGLSIQGDATLPPGGCVIETGHGVIGNTVEDKLDRLKAVFRENV